MGRVHRVHSAGRSLGLVVLAGLAGCAVSTDGGGIGPATAYLAGGPEMSVVSVLTIDPSELATDAAAAAVAGEESDAETLQATASSAGASIRFTPIIGAPLEAVTPLSRQLASAAEMSGIAIRRYEDATSDHVLKGYLAAETSDGETLVIFVWDVLDANGVRLHRIRGVEEVEASDAGWAGVPADVMERIAARTLADYMTWRSARTA